MKQVLFFAISLLFLGQGGQADELKVEKPLIGINTDISGDKPERCEIASTYLDAIKQAGGIPILIPPVQKDELEYLLSQLDGIVLIGGADYPPSIYGEKQDSTVSLMKESRSTFDLSLAKAALASKDLPVLGICAGCQILNIADGGSLNQDIPSMKLAKKIEHASPDGWKNGFHRHAVELSQDSKLSKTFAQKEITVVSSHHQCVNKPGQSFQVAARAPDGVNEAIEMKDRSFVVGVQWHPERDYQSNQQLFKKFVEEAARYHEQKKAKQAAVR